MSEAASELDRHVLRELLKDVDASDADHSKAETELVDIFAQFDPNDLSMNLHRVTTLALFACRAIGPLKRQLAAAERKIERLEEQLKPKTDP